MNRDNERYEDLEMRRRSRIRRQKRMKRQRRRARILFGLFSAFLALLTGAVLGALSLYMEGRIERRTIDLSALVAPDWITQDFFEVNPYSRPGTKMNRVNEIIIHYVANPGTTATQNWNYFNNLKDQKGDKATSASSHFMGRFFREFHWMKSLIPHRRKRTWNQFRLRTVIPARMESLPMIHMLPW